MFGGNIVKTIQNQNDTVFHNNRYHYSLNTTKSFLSQNLSTLKSFTLYSLEGVEVNINNKIYTLEKDQYLSVHNPESIEILSIQAALLSGSTDSELEHFHCERTNLENSKIVVKPWGREYWLKGLGGHYSFKKIILKSGFKTSLQYHEHKEETNVIFDGAVNLVFKSNSKIENDLVTNDDLDRKSLNPITYIHVTPGIVHRLESIDDLTLFETSTPELDDVIRITDDSKRPNGKIDDEHK